MRSATRVLATPILLLLTAFLVSSCASGPREAPRPGTEESLEALLGTALELPDQLQIGSVSIPLPKGSSAVRTGSGAYRLTDADGTIRGTVQFLSRPPGAGLAETAEFVTRELPEGYSVRSIPCRLGLYDAMLWELRSEDQEAETRFVLLVELTGSYVVLETDSVYASLIQHIAVTDEAGSLRVRGELSFFAHDTGWHWLSDLEAGFLLHNSRLEEPVLLAILPEGAEELPFGLARVPEETVSGSVTLYADFQSRDLPYRSFIDKERQFVLLELSRTLPPAVAVLSISSAGRSDGAVEADRVEEILKGLPLQQLFRYGLLFGPAPEPEPRKVHLRLLGED